MRNLENKSRDYKNIAGKKQKFSIIDFWQNYQNKSKNTKTPYFSKSKISKNKRPFENRKNNLPNQKLSNKKLHRSSSGAIRVLDLGFVSKFLLFILKPFVGLFNIVSKKLVPIFSRENVVIIIFVLIFSLITYRLADLQILDINQGIVSLADEIKRNESIIIPAERGQIFIQDLSQAQTKGYKPVAVTTTQNVTNLYFDASRLKEYTSKKKIDFDAAVTILAGMLNIPFLELSTALREEISKENPKSYVILKKTITDDQRKIINYIRSNEELEQKFLFSNWLNIENKETRYYPQGPLLSQVIGFMQKSPAPRDEVVNNPSNSNCADNVLANEQRNTGRVEYYVGYYGLEQKFCSVMAGLNGRLIGKDIDGRNDNYKMVAGANIYTTIDRNIQQRAQQILENAVKANTNDKGGPKSGVAIVMQPKTGKVLGMASYPQFDPNNYSTYDPKTFRNAGTNVDYEVGSVMKPLTIAAALNEFQSGNIGKNGKPLGVPPDFRFEDYDSNGKIYRDFEGKTFQIQNSQAISYRSQGKIGLGECLRDSINTCIAEIVSEHFENRKLQEYLEEKFLLGKKTSLDLPGETTGNTYGLDTSLNCKYCFAQAGFGQGFSISSLQLLRAYTALANGGAMVDPYLIEKVEYPDGKIDTPDSENSIIKREKPKQILLPSVSRQVTDFLLKTVNEGYHGLSPSKAKVDGYNIAGKTGTAEVYTIENGKVCDYKCNREKGMYNHFYVSYGPTENPEVMVLVGLENPKPGQVSNFSDATVGPATSELMRYCLEYFNVPKK